MVMPKDLKFYHWMHSGASLRPAQLEEPVSFLYTVPPQSQIVYMNRLDVVRTAEMYGLFPKDIRVVHNPIDYRNFPNIHPVVKQIINECKLYEADVVAVYPLSTTRMGAGGKQLEKALKVMAFIKKQGKSVRYIIPNAHANAQREKDAIEHMYQLAESYGLTRQELIFTSLLGKNWEVGVPHEVVVQLFQLSDLFIFPSVSENCPLILLEAALTKNLLVLNEDFSPMKDFVGPHALYFKFDSINTVTTHPRGEDSYYQDVAKIIIAELNSNRMYQSAIEIRKHFNLDYIFKQELEPLFYEEGKSPVVEMKFAPSNVPPENEIGLPDMDKMEADFKEFLRKKYDR
jgi:glycosyltransferase involved in cell wall biosynthesis